MPQSILVDGVGPVMFPDDATPEEMQAVLSRDFPPPPPTTGDYLKQAAGSFGRGAVNSLASIPKTIAAGADWLDRNVLDLTPGDQPALQDRLLFKAGQGVENAGQKVLPPNDPRLQGSFLASDLPQGAGQLAGTLALGGTGGLAVKALGRSALSGSVRAANVGGAASEFMDALQAAQQLGDDPDTAFKKAVAYASVATSIENRFGTGRLLRKYFKTADEAAAGLTKLGLGREVVKDVLTGFAEESTQRLAQDLIVSGEPNVEGITREGAVGAVLQGLFGLPANLSRRGGNEATAQPKPANAVPAAARGTGPGRPADGVGAGPAAPAADTSPQGLKDLQSALRGNQLRPAQQKAAEAQEDKTAREFLENRQKDYPGMSALELELLEGLGDQGARSERKARQVRKYLEQEAGEQKPPVQPLGEKPKSPEPSTPDFGARAVQAKGYELAEEEERAAQPPPPVESYQAETGTGYTIKDLAGETGSVGAPKLDDALSALAGGRTAAQVVSDWSGGRGEYDGLADVLEQVRVAADQGRQHAEFKRLAVAYRRAFNEGGRANIDQTLSAIEGVEQGGFTADGRRVRGGDDLIGRLWDHARGERLERALSSDEMSLRLHDVAGSKAGRSAAQNGGPGVDVGQLQQGDRFHLRGTGYEVERVEEDGTVQLRDTGEGRADPQQFGRNPVLDPQKAARIYPDAGTFQPTGQTANVRRIDADSAPGDSTSRELPRTIAGYKPVRLGVVRSPAPVSTDGLRAGGAGHGSAAGDQQRVAGTGERAYRVFEKVFRRRIVVVEDADHPSRRLFFQGAVLPGHPGVLFLASHRANTESVLGHEFIESLALDNPALFDRLRRELVPFIRDLSGWQAQLNALEKQHGISASNSDAAARELIANFVGDCLADEKFLNQLAARNPGLFKQLADALVKFLREVAEKLRPYGANAFFRDVQAAEQRVMAALEEHAGGKGGGGVTGDVRRIDEGGNVEPRMSLNDEAGKQSEGSEWSPGQPTIRDEHKRFSELGLEHGVTWKGKSYAEDGALSRALQSSLGVAEELADEFGIPRNDDTVLEAAFISIRQAVQGLPDAGLVRRIFESRLQRKEEEKIAAVRQRLLERERKEINDRLRQYRQKQKWKLLKLDVAKSHGFDVDSVASLEPSEDEFTRELIPQFQITWIHPETGAILHKVHGHTEPPLGRIGQILDDPFPDEMIGAHSADSQFIELAAGDDRDGSEIFREYRAEIRRIENEIAGDFKEMAAAMRGRLFDKPRFSLSPEDGEELLRQGREYFGTTRDILEAGYVLPDGTMLDFSGRHEMQDSYEKTGTEWRPKAGQRDWQRGGRNVDHREVVHLESIPNGTSATDAMIAFQKAGAMRIDANGSIDMETAPSAAQLRAIERIADLNDGEIYVDVADGNRRAAIEGPAKKVIGQVRRFYRGEELPEHKALFSLSPEDRNQQGEELTAERQRLRQAIQAAPDAETRADLQDELDGIEAELDELIASAPKKRGGLPRNARPAPVPVPSATVPEASGPVSVSAAVAEAARRVSSATQRQGKTLSEWWDGVKLFFRHLAVQVPEIPIFGKLLNDKPAQFAEQFRRGVRLTVPATNAALDKAREAVERVVKPLMELGRGTTDPNTVAKYNDLGTKIEKERLRGPQARANRIDFWTAEQARIEAQLASNPWWLYQQAVLWRDLWWRAAHLKDKWGRAIKLPGNLTEDDALALAQLTDQRIEASGHAEAIRESLRRHYALMGELHKSLREHGEIIPENMANPLYFPHQVLDFYTAKIDAVRPTTEEPFRSYLINPVGSEKLVMADYLASVYKHAAEIYAHNAQVDIAEKYVQPYDKGPEVQANLEAEAERNEQPAPDADAFTWEKNIPNGYVVFKPYKLTPLRPELVIDRRKLSEALGVELGQGDLGQMLKEAGIAARITPDMIIEAYVKGAREITWLLPEEIAEAMTAIQKRMEAARARTIGRLLGLPFEALQRVWKYNVLFNPINWTRYERNNLTSDVLKMAAADPGMFKYLKRAAREIRVANTANGQPTAELASAMKEGVLDTVTAGEAGDLAVLKDFEAFQPDNVRRREALKRLATSPTRGSAFREGVFRYAKFLADLERIRRGDQPEYGGAYAPDIEVLSSPIAKAAEISLKNFGDYSALSPAGKWMRRYLFPFFSWTEVNFRYHANLTRNLVDAVRAGRKGGRDVARVAGVQATMAGVQALRIAVTLGAIRMAFEAWNQWGGQVFGLWDDDDEPEKKLSEADRRRLHLILGKDANGKIRVAQVADALGDVLQYFGGNNFARLGMEWARGQITLQQWATDSAKQMPVDTVNAFIQGLRPDAKALYMMWSGKSAFPDVTQQRNISRHDLTWNILSEMTDRSGVMGLRALLDKDHYSPTTLGEWAQQQVLGVRRRDPEQWGYFEIKDRAAEWYEDKTGKASAGDWQSPDQVVLRNFRKAIYRGDVEHAVRFYHRALDLGYTAERFRASLANQDPLAVIPDKANRAAFVAQLTQYERDLLTQAMRYYSRLAASRGREAGLFPQRGRPGFPPQDARLQGMMERRQDMDESQVDAMTRQLIERSTRPVR